MQNRGEGTMKMQPLGYGYFKVNREEFLTNFKPNENYEVVDETQEADVILRMSGFYQGMTA
jgi:hypothetical protein